VPRHKRRAVHNDCMTALVRIAAILSAGFFLTLPVFAAEAEREGALHGFPALLDLSGNKLADGDFSQTAEGDRILVKLSYAFHDHGRRQERTGDGDQSTVG